MFTEKEKRKGKVLYVLIKSLANCESEHTFQGAQDKMKHQLNSVS